MSGDVPRELCARRPNGGPSLVEVFHASSNQLTGTVDWISNCPSLLTLDLAVRRAGGSGWSVLG
jgi:hypothetical protein